MTDVDVFSVGRLEKSHCGTHVIVPTGPMTSVYGESLSAVIVEGTHGEFANVILQFSCRHLELT